MAAWQNTTQAAQALSTGLGNVGQAARSAGQHLSDMNESVVSLGTALRAGVYVYVYKQIAEFAKRIAVTSSEQLHTQREQLIQAKVKHQDLADELAALEASQQTHTDIYQLKKELHALGEEALDQEEKRLHTATVFNDLYKKYSEKHTLQVGVAASAYFIARKSAEEARTLNGYLIQANTAYSARYDLVAKTFNVQRQLGASTQSLGVAAEALVDYGMELESTFGDNLKLVTMMKEGLGVSASTGAQLVVTFERGLKQSARDVGDLVARIAAQTGLAAQKAAQYAIEMGRALRLVGRAPADAVGVIKAVESVASRVEEMGGNSEVIVRTYKQMLGGTSEAFMLRGRAQVGFGSLGTGAGATQALEGLARSMRAVVNAAPGTENYAAQLQAAAELHQMAAEDVRDFLEAMTMSSRVVSESEALQKAYTRQTQMVGKAWDQMRESLLALYRRAMVPLLEAVAPLIQGLADTVKWIADSKAAILVAGASMVVGLYSATRAMYALTKAALTFASTSNIGQLIPGVKGIGSLIGRLTVIGQVAKSFPAWTGVKSIGEMMGAGVGRMGVAAGIGGAAAGVLSAAGIGYLVGTVINNALPQTWRDKIGDTLYKIAGNTAQMAKISQQNYAALGRVRAQDAMENAAQQLSKMVMAGNLNPTQAMTYLLKNAHAMGIPMRELTAQGFQEQVAARMQKINREAAYVESLKGRTTVRSSADIERDKELAQSDEIMRATVESKDATKELVRTQDKALKLQLERARLQLEEKHGTFYYFWRPDDSESARRAYSQGRWGAY